MSDIFGKAQLTFPIGSFQYTWIKGVDFNVYDVNMSPFNLSWFAQLYNEKFFSNEFPIDTPTENPEKKILEHIFNTNLHNAAKQPSEVWFTAPKGSYSLYSADERLLIGLSAAIENNQLSQLL